MHAKERSFSPRASLRVPACARFGGVLVCTLLCGLVCLAQTPPPAPAGRVVVSDVVVQGNHLIPTQTIMAQIKTRPGMDFSEEAVREDARTLMATKQFGNIEVYHLPEADNKVKVYFCIRDCPSVVQKVTYLGAKHLKDDDLNNLTGIRKEAPLNPIQNKLGCRAIVARYNEMGRPFAECVLLRGDQPGDTEVVFQITEGPEVAVRDITFEGNTFVSGPVLATHLNSSKKFLRLFGGKLNPAMVDADVAKLEEYYKSFGFHDVRVSRELQWAADGREVTLVFHIQEGIRYKVQDVPQIDGNVRFMPAEQLQALSQVKAGEYYNQSAIDGDLSRMKDYIGYYGREARAQAVPYFSKDVPGLVTVHYEIEESAPARVGQIFIIGNDRTRQNVILRQVPLYPGQILTYPDLRVAERNLQKLNIFASSPDGAVRPTVSVLESPNEYKDVVIHVQEDNTGSLLFGIGVNSDAGLTGSIVLNERNFDITRPPTSFEDLLSGNAWRGAGQEFRAEAVPGTQLQRYTVSFREPFLFDTPNSLGVSGYYYQRQYNEYEEDRVGGRLTVGRKLNQYWSASTSVRVENVDVLNVALGAPVDYTSVQGNNFLVGLRAGVTRDSRDSYLRPTQGSLLDISYEQVLGDHVYPLVNVDFNKYWTVWQRADGSGRHVLALHSQFGWAGDNTPVYDRYFAGGFRSLRGFQFRGVGPSVNGFEVGGDFLFLNSLEYQIPVKADDQIYFVGFVDSGTVESRINQWTDYRVSAGFGVRFTVPMLGPVPIALDFGFPIVKGPGDHEQVFSFWLGFFR
jgi:outer membrane protein assembly complex protein YaeT